MRRFPSWYRATASAFVLLWGIVGAYYAIGASSVRASGATTSFDRSHDISLLKIDEHRAFRLDKYGASVTKYERGTFPFCPICGVFKPAGTVMNLAGYRKGDWVYTAHPQPFSEAVNLKTGEVVDLPADRGELSQPPPEFVARGLDFDKANAIDPSLIASTFTPLSTINESCVVFNMAFIAVFGALLLVGLVLAMRRPRGS
jgi:hypothetical protein